jgi:hypothetical protein
MRARVYKGELIYVDTEAKCIQIEYENNEGIVELVIADNVELPPREKWESLIGCIIGATELDGKVTSIYFPDIEE